MSASAKPIRFLASQVPPAWNSDIFVCQTSRYAPPKCFDPGSVELFFKWQTSDPGSAQAFPREAGNVDVSKWHEPVALALAKGSILMLTAGSGYGSKTNDAVMAFSYEEQKEMLRHSLPSKALPGGLLVDRHGQVIVALSDGKLICFGPRFVDLKSGSLPLP